MGKTGFVQGILEGLRYPLEQQLKSATTRVSAAGYKFKRQLFSGALELFLLLSGVGFLLIGFVLLLRRFAPLDLVLLVLGLLLVNVLLLFRKFK